MRKDYLILLAFLGIVLISGAVIFIVGGSRPAQSFHGQGLSQESTQMPPAVDSLKVKKQIEILENRLRTDPNNYEAFVELGNIFYDSNNPPKAIEYYERALKIRPNDPMVMVDLGAMYRQSGDPDKALDLFNKAIGIDPKLPQAYFNLGMVLRMEKRDPAGAARAWRKYLELDPDSQAKEFLQEEINKAEAAAK